MIELSFDMAPYKVYATSRVPADTGCAAVQRGPVVYCAEGVDNGGDVLSLSLREGGALWEKPYDPGLLGGIVPLVAEGWKARPAEEPHPAAPRGAADIRLVPITPGATGGRTRCASGFPKTDHAPKTARKARSQFGPERFLWLSEELPGFFHAAEPRQKGGVNDDFHRPGVVHQAPPPGSECRLWLTQDGQKIQPHRSSGCTG